MKPIHAVILILTGALVGAMGLKMVQTAKVPAAPSVMAQVPSPSAEPTAPPAESVATPAAIPEPPKPSPMPVTHATATTRPPAPPPPPSPTVAPPPARTEPEHVTPPPPQGTVVPVPQPSQVTLNAGQTLPVRLLDGLSSERNAAGDVFLATLDQELAVEGWVIAERGARVEGRVVAADRGGKVHGTAALAVELTQLRTSDGQTVAIHTESVFQRAGETHGTDAAKVGAGAAIGAVIGAIAGGGKGAAIGAGVGGGAGAGDVLLTRGKPAELPSETRLTFRLKTAVKLTERLR